MYGGWVKGRGRYERGRGETDGKTEREGKSDFLYSA